MHKDNITNNLDMILDHMQYKQSSEFSETHREESEISESNRAYTTRCESDGVSAGHTYKQLRDTPDYPHPTRQGGQTPNTYKHSSKFRETHREESEISEFGTTYRTNYESGGTSTTQNYTEQRIVPEHPHLMRQCGQTLNSYKEAVANKLNQVHFGELSFIESYSAAHGLQGKFRGCNSDNYWAILGGEDTEERIESFVGVQDYTPRDTEEEDTKLQFNTRKLPTARGHIVHSWDILLDMGTQVLEVTLPQLIEGTCKSQTICSLSFGSKGNKSVDLDIITSLRENHCIECWKGAIIARRYMKQRYGELGFTKTVSSGRAIYIDTLVTVGPSNPILTARVVEHAKKRKRQMKISKQKTASKVKTQMTAIGIVMGGIRGRFN